MIDRLTVEEAIALDKSWFSPYAKAELALSDDLTASVFRQSEYIWLGTRNGRKVALGGIVRASLLSTANLWFLLGGDIRREDLRDGRDIGSVLLSFYPRVQTPVDVAYATGGRFAIFCGFLPTERMTVVWDRVHRIYEVER